MLSNSVLLPNNRLIEFFYYELDFRSPIIALLKKGKLWELKLYNLYSKFLTKDSVVLDIGAFVGTHTACFACLAKQVYAFEPVSKPYKCLVKMLNENNLDNVEAFNFAISDKFEEKEMLTNYDGDSRFAEHCSSNTKFKFNETINCYTIDSMDLERVDLMKIDTEKNEWKVLIGAQETIKRCRPIIFLETFRTKQNMRHLETFSKENNYSAKYLKCDDYLLTPL